MMCYNVLKRLLWVHVLISKSTANASEQKKLLSEIEPNDEDLCVQTWFYESFLDLLADIQVSAKKGKVNA